MAAAKPQFDASVYKDGVLDQVLLDDFTYKTPTGREITPHKGESVWLLPYGFTLEDETRIQKFRALAQGDATGEKLDAQMDAMCDILSRIIVGWDVTDERGQPYEQPHANPAAIGRIPSRLLYHLIMLIQGGETEGKGESA